MPIFITMPRLSDTMEEGTLVAWKVKVGDKVSAGDVLADVETDKATMELACYDDGTVARLAVQEGATLPIGAMICVLAAEGESVEAAAKAVPSEGTVAETGSAKAPEQAAASASESTRSASTTEPVKASPLARKLAEEKGIDLTNIEGTGPGGRVIKRDILGAGGKPAPAPVPAASPRPATPSAPRTEPGERASPSVLTARTVPLTQMRKTIARRLVESKTTVPHFQVAVAINMDPLMALRQTINDQLASQGVKLSVNDFITKAAALACVQHPVVNASWSDAGVVYHGQVNVGIAIALPLQEDGTGGGLVVATLRDVVGKGLRQISEEVKSLAALARKGGLKPEQMSDSTLTISNLGMPQYGVTQFTAIINPPNAAILAVGASLEKPVVRNGQIVVGQEMCVTLSGDHRVIDGAVAAEYLATLRTLLENPASLLV